MYRKELIELLQEKEWTVRELAARFGVPGREIESELEHVRRTLRREGLRLEVEPARCRKCGFVFRKETLGKPGKCPECRSTWIAEPRIRIVPST